MSDNSKKLILILFVCVVVVIIIPLFLFVKKENKINTKSNTEEKSSGVKIEENKDSELFTLETSIESSKSLGRLPLGEERIGVDFSQEDESSYIEYLSFLDFYKKIENNYEFSISDYDLPLNIRTDIVNYYDVSRRLDLDPYIDSLSNNGFAVMDNQLLSKSFYNIYDELYENKIPLFISSDFLIYYHQESLKKIFKDVEKNIFYKNLWDINFVLYEKAKKRYEERLSSIGNINDRVLEAQRLTAAYFATSLELLKPKDGQIAQSGDLSNEDLFSFFEGDIYSFNLPDYLKVDVLKEVDFIISKKQTTKSPVLLYDRDYKDFVIPNEYSSNAKLNNFYLATKWLSSTFPLHYQGDDCPDCYLDFDDWRISMISAAFIANDIFNNHDLKNDWARIYKTLSFFKGLRGDLSYVHYRDALNSLFEEDYDISKVFDDNNPESVENLYKFQSKILDYNFLDIEGAFNKDKDKAKLGVKMLADFYWPNDYIFNQLSYPNVSLYLEENNFPKSNVTACKLNNKTVRCNGFSLDIVNLISPNSLKNNQYYYENSKFQSYQDQIRWLRSQLEKFPKIWHYNNYWQTLKIAKDYLGSDKNEMPIFTKNLSWQNKELHTAVGAWINLQLSMDNLKVHKKHERAILGSGDFSFIDKNYIEPNLDLINEQLASTLMVYEMFSLLKITEELRSSFMDLENLKDNLEKIKEIMVKELRDDNLSLEELSFISTLAREYKVEKDRGKILNIESPNNKKIVYNISDPKLVAVIFKRGDSNYISVGPIFSYIEK